MRLLVVANNFPWPGRPFDGIFNLAQLRALVRRGWEPRVIRFVPRAPPLREKWRRYREVPERYDVEGIPVRTLRAMVGPRSLGLGTVAIQLKRSLSQEMATFAPDVIHAQGLLPAGLLAGATGRPYVVTAHGSEAYRLPWTRPGLARAATRALRPAAWVTAVSGFVAAHLRRLGREQVEVIFNGADEAIFKPQDRSAARKALQLPERPTIAFAGHLEREKGTLDLLSAAALLRDLNPVLVLAGSGSLRSRLEDIARSHRLDVRFLGAVEQDRLALLYAAADVLALPSHFEGLGAVICEAMSSARAVVASKVGGIPEIVRDGVTGFTVPAQDAAALAARLRTILTDSEIRSRFESEAGAFARQRLGWEQNAARYDEIYRQAAS
jgi:glycosyltransferase involved in cell wall biosynthesis